MNAQVCLLEAARSVLLNKYCNITSQTDNVGIAVYGQLSHSVPGFPPLKEEKNTKYSYKLNKLLLTIIATTHKKDLSKGKFWEP